MLLTANAARTSVVVFAAVFAILTALWIRSAGRFEYLGIQYEGKYCGRLMQSNGSISFSIDPGADAFMKPGFNLVQYDTYKPEPGANLWWGAFWFGADLYDPFGFRPSMSAGIPYWFALCLSFVLLMPAVAHRRLRKNLTDQLAASGSDMPPD